MTTKNKLQAFGASTLLFALSSSAIADVVETKSGARIIGRVKSIDGSAVVVNTDFAGEIKIKQSEVVSINTEAPITVRLAGGSVLEGTLKSEGNSALQIVGGAGSISASVADVAATWAPGETDPAHVALRRTWAYEASMDVIGKSGNRDQLGTAFGFSAVLATPQDSLKFYAGYNRQETDGEKSADQFRAGLDYSNNFSGKYSWYARNEGGFDRVKDIELYNTAAAGFGYDFIKEGKQTLTGRAGLAFRYEGYETVGVEALKAAGLDFALNHSYKFENASLISSISYVPTFEDFANFRLVHDTALSMPLANPAWSLRMGVNNDYTSEPASAGIKRLDTTYYSKFVLNWK